MIILNYFKTSFRGLKKQKSFSFINLFGLAFGLAIFIIFFEILQFFTGYDSIIKDKEKIFSVVEVFNDENRNERHSAFTPKPLTASLKSEIPEIEDITRYYRPFRVTLKYKDNIFYENGGLVVNPNFLSFFSYNIISGDKNTMLEQPNGIIITKSYSTKYFGDESPIGKLITLNNKIDLVVTGITEDIPENSSIYYDFLISFETARPLLDITNDWNTHNISSYVKLPVGYSPQLLEKKFSTFVKNHYPRVTGSPSKIYLLSLSDLSTRPYNIKADARRYDRTNNYLFIILGFMVLGLACINYMNLSTARYTDRLKEVGVRKSIGASKGKLINQFLGESVFLACLAFPFALLIHQIAIPFVKELFPELFDFSIWSSPITLIQLLGITILVGIFSGFYPAFLLSSFKPTQILRGAFKSGKKGSLLRKTLVIVQFSFSIIIIFLVLMIREQLNFYNIADLGYSRDGVIRILLPQEAKGKLTLLNNELKAFPGVVSVTAASGIPGHWGPEEQVIPENQTDQSALTMTIYGIDYDFVNVMNLKIQMGRDFSKEFKDENSFIINELAAKKLGWENPLGKSLTFGDKKGTIVGVTNDFHFVGVDVPTPPALLYLESKKLTQVFVKISDNNQIPAVIGEIKKVWKKLFPELPFVSESLRDYFRDLTNENLVIFMGVVGFIAIIFSSLGLFGLVSYSVKQRTKEIGIRKALGAKASELVIMLGKNFIKLIVISNLIGLPLSYFLSENILSKIAIHTKIGIEIFLIAVIVTLSAAVISIAYQVIKASKANPVNSLKYE